MDELFDIPSSPSAVKGKTLIAAGLLAVIAVATGWLVAGSQSSTTWIYPMGAVILGGILLWPALPIALYYPLLWPAWLYYFPGGGGRERFIGILAILGLGVAVLRFR